MTDPKEPQKNIGDKTKRYLSALISDLRGKATDQPAAGTQASTPVVPPEPHKPPIQTSFFSGSLSPTPPSDDQDDSGAGHDKGKIKLTEKEQALLKAFRKLS